MSISLPPCSMGTVCTSLTPGLMGFVLGAGVSLELVLGLLRYWGRCSAVLYPHLSLPAILCCIQGCADPGPRAVGAVPCKAQHLAMHEVGFPIPYLAPLSMPLQELMERFRAVLWEPEEPLGRSDAEGFALCRRDVGQGCRQEHGTVPSQLWAPTWQRDQPSSSQFELPGSPGTVYERLLGSFATLHHFLCVAESL